MVDLRAALKFRRDSADMNAMSHDLLNRIDQRTRLAGHNRLALLLFRLGGRQLFGVNVFKVQEVLRRPELFQVPGLPLQFSGVADVRGRSVPVLDLGLAIGHPEREPNADTAPGYLVVTEFKPLGAGLPGQRRWSASSTSRWKTSIRRRNWAPNPAT